MRKYLREVKSFYQFIAVNFNHYKEKEVIAEKKMNTLATNGKARERKTKRTKLKQQKKNE